MSFNRFLLIFHHLRLPCESGGLRSFHILNQFLRRQYAFDELILLVPCIDTLTGQESYLYKNRKKQLFSNTKIIFIKSLPFDKSNSFQRYISFIVYSLVCCYKVITIKRCSVYMCSTYSLPVLLMTSIVSKFKKSLLFVEIRDLFLHGYMSILGRTVFSPFAKYFICMLKYFESVCLRSAILIFPNSPGFLPALTEEYKIIPKNIKCILLGVDDFSDHYQTESIDTVNYPLLYSRTLETVSQYECNLVYCGSLDKVHSSSPLIQLCESINRRSLSIAIHLFGTSKSHISISKSFDFVYAYGNLSKSLLSQVLPIFDCGLYFSSEIFPFDSILGNKIFDYISAQIPIVFLTQSFALRFSKDHNIGFKIDPLRVDKRTIDFIFSFVHKNKSYLHSCCDRLNSSKQCGMLVDSILDEV